MSFLKRLLLRRKISRQWAFNVAVVSGDWDKAEALHRRHPDLVFSKALLPTAVKGGRNEIVEWLLANNADVNGMDDENYCALHHAAAKGRQQMVELLLARRADVNLKHAGYRYYNGSASLLEWGGFDDGNMPLHYAAFFGHKEVAELLLAAKAEVNAKEKSAGYAPLHWAAIKGHKNVTELLLANNAEVDARSSRGWTPLHYAALFGHKCMAELLLANHCDVNAINHDGETPWKLANSGQGWPNGRPISSERKDVAELLLRHGGRR